MSVYPMWKLNHKQNHKTNDKMSIFATHIKDKELIFSVLNTF